MEWRWRSTWSPKVSLPGDYYLSRSSWIEFLGHRSVAHSSVKITTELVYLLRHRELRKICRGTPNGPPHRYELGAVAPDLFPENAIATGRL
jgi:hypothetical protein